MYVEVCINIYLADIRYVLRYTHHLIVAEVGVGACDAQVVYLNECMPDVCGIGKFRQGLPERRGEEAIGHAAIAILAGKHHPSQGHGPGDARERHIESFIHNGQPIAIRLIWIDGEHAGEYEDQTS